MSLTACQDVHSLEICPLSFKFSCPCKLGTIHPNLLKHRCNATKLSAYRFLIHFGPLEGSKKILIRALPPAQNLRLAFKQKCESTLIGPLVQELKRNDEIVQLS